MNNAPRSPVLKRKLRNILINLNSDIFDILEISKNIDNQSQFSMLEYYVMALEDRRFLKHSGYDIKAIVRNFWRMITFRNFGGSSTIDMQMVRTITGFKEKTIFRKVYEIILAHIINHKLSKKQIIRIYLDKAFFGSQLYGIELASQNIFKKNPYLLTDRESALLAAMLLRPKPLRENNKWGEKTSIRASYAQSIWVSIKERFN